MIFQNIKFIYEKCTFDKSFTVIVYGCDGWAICGVIKKLIINEVIGLSNAYLIEEARDKNQFSVE